MKLKEIFPGKDTPAKRRKIGEEEIAVASRVLRDYKDAKATDVLYLIDQIKKTIKEKNDLNIECEIIYFGDKEE